MEHVARPDLPEAVEPASYQVRQGLDDGLALLGNELGYRCAPNSMSLVSQTQRNGIQGSCYDAEVQAEMGRQGIIAPGERNGSKTLLTEGRHS
jgi:hypothetical protein